MRTLAALLLLLLAGAAHAQDGGFTAGSGLVLGPPVVVFPQARPIAIDSQDRIVVQPLDPSAQPVGPLECWDAAGAARLSTFTTGAGDFSTLFAGLGQSTFVTASWGGAAGLQVAFTRHGCSAAGVPAGTFSHPALYTPQQTGQNLAPLLSNGDPVYPTAGGLIRVSLAATTPTSTVLLSTVALDAALGSFGLVEPDGGPRTIDQRIVALAVDPSDHLWAVVERRIIGGPRYQWIVELTLAGQVTVRRGPDLALSAQTELIYDLDLDAMLVRARVLPLGGTLSQEALGVIPRTGPDGLAARIPPWPLVFDPLFNGRALGALVGGATSGPRVVTSLNGFELRPLSIDKSLADFDRDGLERSEEELLGTSDFLADSDTDGVPDGLELRLTATAPTDAGSAPARADAGPGRVLAESLFSNTWSWLDAGALCVHHAGHSAGPALSVRIGNGQCGLPNGDYRFVKADGSPLSPHVGASFVPPTLNPELTHAFLIDSLFNWKRLDLQTGALEPLDAGVPLEHLLPLSKDVTIAIEGSGSFGAEKLWRLTPQGAFVVIDPRRAGCPVLGDPSQLANCGSAELAFIGIKRFHVRGWDPVRKLALVVVWTDHGAILLGVGADRAVYLAGLLDSAEGLDPLFIAPLGAQGWELQLGLSSASRTFLGSRFVDPFFQPLEGLFNPLDVSDFSRTGNFFRHGFFTTQLDSVLQEGPAPGPNACRRLVSIFSCDLDSTPLMKVDVLHPFTAELIPVGPAIEKGEVLFFARDTFGAESASFRDADGGYGRYLGADGWRLWRLTPAGAALPWLDAASFTARLDAASRAKVAAKPLTPISSMGASPNGLAICLAEATAGRVWQLLLDPTTRQLSSIFLTEPAEGVGGCAYDSANQFAVLTKAPAMIRSAGKPDLSTGAEYPTDLLRLPGRWAVISYPSHPSRCVADDGTLAELPVWRLSAAAPAFGGVAWIDEAGGGWLAPADAFCAGKAIERLGAASGSNVWMDLFGGFTFRAINSRRATITVRPDGVIFAGSAELNVGGLGFNPPTVPRLPFFYFPSYAPLDAANRMSEVDAFRASAPRAFQAARKPAELFSSVLVPGAPADADFGHLNRAPPVPPPTSNADGGAGGGAGGSSPRGCGCGSAPGLFAAAALLLLARRRRC